MQPNLIERLEAHVIAFGSDTEGLTLIPESWNSLRADIAEAVEKLKQAAS